MKKHLLVLILCCISLFQSTLSSQDRIISQPLHKRFDMLGLNISIGDNTEEEMDLMLDMSIDFLWADGFYNLKSKDVSETLSDEQIKLSKDYLMAEKLLASFHMKNSQTIIENFTFYFVRDPYSTDSFASFPLAFKVRNESLSMIHSLYNRGIISKKGFSIISNGNKDEEPTLYLGGIPENYIKNSNKIFKCKVNNHFNRDYYFTWGCNLRRITIGEFNYYNKYYAYFQSSTPFMKNYVPRDFMDFLRIAIFKELFKKELCHYKSYFQDNEEIECKKSIINSIPDMEFQFEGVNFVLNKENMFRCHKDICDFLMIQNTKNSSEWRLGTTFITQYPSYFDYENEYVYFYEHSPSIFSQKSKLSIFMLITISVLIPSIVMMYFVNRKYKSDLNVKNKYKLNNIL